MLKDDGITCNQKIKQESHAVARTPCNAVQFYLDKNDSSIVISIRWSFSSPMLENDQRNNNRRVIFV